jgi:hypothetical protein
LGFHPGIFDTEIINSCSAPPILLVPAKNPLLKIRTLSGIEPKTGAYNRVLNFVGELQLFIGLV